MQVYAVHFKAAAYFLTELILYSVKLDCVREGRLHLGQCAPPVLVSALSFGECAVVLGLLFAVWPDAAVRTAEIHH